MKKLVWFLGTLLVLSFVFPDGIHIDGVPSVVVPDDSPTDPTIKKLLASATPEDKARVNGIYSGLRAIIKREQFGDMVPTTEKWALLQANTLMLAVEQVNKYPGLDVAINDVFKQQLGADEVLAVNSDVVNKLATACEIIANSAVSK